MANKADSVENGDGEDNDKEDSRVEDEVQGAVGGEDMIDQKVQPGSYDKQELSLQQTDHNGHRDAVTNNLLDLNLEKNEKNKKESHNERRDSHEIHVREEERPTHRNNLSSGFSFDEISFHCLHGIWSPDHFSSGDMVDLRTRERIVQDVLIRSQYNYGPTAIPFENRRMFRPEDVEVHENQQACVFNHDRCQGTACEVSGVNSEERSQHSEPLHPSEMFNRQLQEDKPD